MLSTNFVADTRLIEVDVAKHYFETLKSPDAYPHVWIVYCNKGQEGTFIITKATAILGTIVKWSYDSSDAFILRCVNSSWQSDDWEKLSGDNGLKLIPCSSGTEYNLDNYTIGLYSFQGTDTGVNIGTALPSASISTVSQIGNIQVGASYGGRYYIRVFWGAWMPWKEI